MFEEETYLDDFLNDELAHYGVLGMKWGVRRGSKKARSAQEGKHNSGVKQLRKHQNKINKKITQLDKSYEKLQSTRSHQIANGDVEAARASAEAARLRRKQNGRFVSDRKYNKLDAKANKLELRADELKAKSEATKAKIQQNRELKKMFEKGLNDIDEVLIKEGLDYLYEHADTGKEYKRFEQHVPRVNS